MWRKPIQIFLDFDGTLTRKDTLEQLAHVCYSSARPDPQIARPWKELANAYTEDLSKHNEQQPAPTVKNFESYISYLHSLRGVESRSAARVAAAIGNNATRTECDNGAFMAVKNKTVQFRTGWLQLIRYMLRSNSPPFGHEGHHGLNGPNMDGAVTILSVNWSAYWIYSCLRAGAEFESPQDATTTDSESPLDYISILANNDILFSDPVAEHPSGHLHGHLHKKTFQNKPQLELRTSDNKLTQMRLCTEAFADSLQGFEDQKVSGVANPLVLYVGDSPTDIECLCLADIGICIRDEPMSDSQAQLKQVLESTYKVPWIGEYRSKPFDPKVKLWARDFIEIESFVRSLNA